MLWSKFPLDLAKVLLPNQRDALASLAELSWLGDPAVIEPCRVSLEVLGVGHAVKALRKVSLSAWHCGQVVYYFTACRHPNAVIAPCLDQLRNLVVWVALKRIDKAWPRIVCRGVAVQSAEPLDQ